VWSSEGWLILEKFPWWTDFQRKLADEVEEFADEYMPRAIEAVWTRKFPWDIIKAIGEKGWLGATIPEKYGGMYEKSKITGACIIAEGMGRLSSMVASYYNTTMFGGCYQIAKFGTEEQKERWLPKMAEGKLCGAICLTEPFVGSDAAAVETVAIRDGNEYIINGKKRFISNSGIADIYLVYARTSDDPKDRENYRHLTAFVVEKGTPGLRVEKINELGVADGVRNGYLDLDNVRVPAENVIGGEGNGWLVMISGLNFERLLLSAGLLGGMKEALRMALYVTRRRVQFGRRTIEFQTNQLRIADITMWYKLSRLIVYYGSYLLDQGREPILESTIAKIFTSEMCQRIGTDAVLCMGGDGLTKFYFVEMVHREGLFMQIGAGTNDVLRILLARMVRRLLGDEVKEPRRRISEKYGIPLNVYKREQLKPKFESTDPEDLVLEALAEDYRANPGLYMLREDIEEDTGIKGDKLDEILESLERKRYVKLYREKGKIRMAKATYIGLRKIKPLEYYQWFPDWVEKGIEF